MPQPEGEGKEKTNESVRHRGGSGNNDKSKSQINAEYFQALEQWLNDVRSYKYSCSVFAGLSYAMMAQQMNGFSTSSINNFLSPISPFNQGSNSFAFPHIRQQQQQSPQPNRQSGQQQNEGEAENVDGVEYTIPPFWKRFIAELVDFILLFMMKLAITFIAVDFFDILDLEEYNFQQQQDKMDYQIVLEITSKILSLEILYKFIVCLYEGIFLRKGIPNQIGGATPGKTFMGIRVVLCDSVEPVENRPNVVKVYPATDLGFGWSFARALLKNLVLALLLPVCFPFLFNKFNRTTYDILCHSVVVEDRVQPDRNR